MATNMEEKIESRNRELKHLGFVKIAAIQVLVMASNLYDYAKQNSGPLKSTVRSVEGAVTAVVGPVFEKFNSVPSDVLVFLDRKVDEATYKIDKHTPPLAKQVVRKTQCMIQKASEEMQTLVHKAEVGGPGAAAHYAAAEFKHFCLSRSVRVWIVLDQITPFHVVAEIALPTAVYCSQRYNRFVTSMARKGYTVFSYLPLVPFDEIAKEFKKGKAGKEEENAAAKESHESSSTKEFKKGMAGKEEENAAAKELHESSSSSDSD